MVRPRRFLRALTGRSGLATAGIAVCVPLGLALTAGLPPASASAPPVSAAAAPATVVGSAREPLERDTAPLKVTIASMSRSSLPARGSITVRGTVTNRSDETWTTVRLYAINGTELAPMTDPDDLAAAMDVAYDAEVGQRLVDVGEPGRVEVLEPGATARYVVKVPAAELEPSTGEAPADGVYWFGIHALGQGGALPRDDLADGRARTFLPYLPRDTDPIRTALVVPLTHGLTFDSDGSVGDEEQWITRLSPGGRLRDLLGLGQAAADAGVPMTWLVDPALIDVIGQLAEGNPPRSIAPSAPVGEEGEEGEDSQDPGGTTSPGEPEASGEPLETPSSEPEPEPGADPPSEEPVALAARDWLEAADDVFSSGEVLTLPYGNTDVAATQQADPGLLDLALAQRSTTLTSLGVESTTALSAPGGYVDSELVAAAPDDVPLLVSDRFVAAPAPTLAGLDGNDLVITSYGATQGSPGPGRSLTAVGLRQRVLAEAAVRARSDGDAEPSTSVSGQPLVVMLPVAWNLSTAERLVDRLTSPWSTFGTLADVIDTTASVELSDDDLVDPREAAGSPDPESSVEDGSPVDPEFRVEIDARSLRPDTLEAVQDLIGSGEVLQRILVENAEIGARVTEQALSGLSYALRREQRNTQISLALSQRWIDDRLGAIGITASPGVTLSGDSGTFLVTLTNDLDEAVTVDIEAVSDEGLTIDPVDPIVLGAQSRTSVLLNATTTTSRVHTVTLMVTDVDGVPLGASDQLPIRSLLVSGVIWVIIGVGVGTLFVAIALRLRRRLVAARRDGAAPA